MTDTRQNPERTVFHAYGWDDLAEKLVDRPGATTPWPEKPKDQLEAEEELLQRLVDLNHQRAAEEAKGKIRWLRPDYQATEESAEQGQLKTTNTDAPGVKATKRRNFLGLQNSPGSHPGSRNHQLWLADAVLARAVGQSGGIRSNR